MYMLTQVLGGHTASRRKTAAMLRSSNLRLCSGSTGAAGAAAAFPAAPRLPRRGRWAEPPVAREGLVPGVAPAGVSAGAVCGGEADGTLRTSRGLARGAGGRKPSRVRACWKSVTPGSHAMLHPANASDMQPVILPSLTGRATLRDAGCKAQ